MVTPTVLRGRRKGGDEGDKVEREKMSKPLISNLMMKFV
jgi:hypothetical protein